MPIIYKWNYERLRMIQLIKIHLSEYNIFDINYHNKFMHQYLLIVLL